MPNTTAPETDIDLFTDEALLNPFPHYQTMRDMGAVIWMNKLNMFAMSRFKDVKEALRNWQVFSSAEGVALNDGANHALRGTTLASDPPLHDKLRAIVQKPLTGPAVRDLTDQITTEAESLLDRLVAKGEFDAIAEFAWHLPLTIVSKLVGLDDAARHEMPEWSAAAFNAGSFMNERAMASFPKLGEMVQFLGDPNLRNRLAPGGWGARIFEAADRGDITLEQAPMLLGDYLGPSLDTTMSAAGSTIWLLGQHPEQFDMIRQDPTLIPNAILEVIRLESPIQSFTRVLTEDVDIEGVTMPKGARVALWYGSANRDERKWEDPERFDIKRNVVEHLGFGHGMHACVGMHLARLEIHSLLTALTKRVTRLELGQAKRGLNNGLRFIEHLPVKVH